LQDNPLTEDDAMNKFVSRFESQVTGVLSGFDRFVFRGSLIPLMRERGMQSFLRRARVRLLDFKSFVLETSDNLKQGNRSAVVLRA
jgi:hypothetical protein